MKNAHRVLFGFVFIVCLVLARQVNAEQYTLSVSGNGNGSSNSISVEQAKDVEVKQTNSAEISNSVDVKVNTGNNTVDGSTNGNASITTGDAKVVVSVQNDFNKNLASAEPCCKNTTPTPAPSIHPTPTIYDPGEPTPTTVPAIGGGSSSGSNNDSSSQSSSNNSSSQGSSNISEVKGLSYTSSINRDLFVQLFGIVCLIGSQILRLQKRSN